MIRHSVVVIVILIGLITPSFVRSSPVDAATNAELVPGSRIVFPYYDLRPGFSTLLFLTNVSTAPVSVNLQFYDTSCARQSAGIDLSADDIDMLDLRRIISGNASGSFQQGFIDVTADTDVLIGTAVVTNMAADWAIAYNGAPARRLADGATPYEPYPTRLSLPAFLTSGQLESGDLTDGLLIVAAPHPTSPGAALPDMPIRVSAEIVLKREDSPNDHGQPHPHDLIRRSSGFRGHYIVMPIGRIAGVSVPTLGRLSLTNHAVDATTGIPFGLVGLYIQTLLRSDGGAAMAVRLPADPSSTNSTK